MKKLILLALAVVMMAGCEESNEAPKCGEANQFSIIMVDSCEYLLRTYTAGYSGYGYLAHKGNCRFCAERRKQELKELVKELKGE